MSDLYSRTGGEDDDRFFKSKAAIIVAVDAVEEPECGGVSESAN